MDIGAHSKVAVIGTGSVGSSIAYALMLKNIANEVLLVDAIPERARGQEMDLSDSNVLSSTRVRYATIQEAGQADVIIITAGAKQREGESRTELIDRNYDILENVIGAMRPIKRDAVMLIVANPVDVLTFFAQKLSGLPRRQVFGSGTFLDSSRLKVYLSERLKVNFKAIHAAVLGEHGDSQFIAWESANVAGKPLLSFPEMKDIDKEKIRRKIAGKAMDIIKLKGSTYYGIAACTVSLCESIIRNKHDVRPLSVYVEKLGVTMSMPAKLGWHGIEEVYDVPLSESEQEQLWASAKSLRTVCEKYNT
ncbi:lactate dehydrogenase B [Radiomyces spectabilis]|uniref:lactate dehydrogenase B n=1 Tax=Radiomyces spectabilis TaxID=64574 RepID=UPI00221F8805|nr:lactate dehydrogenase B [Radiomyces spectabilis]KAI8369565.1 lactate dehydrogenase B [Radiomyces spectabilis]